MGRSEEGNILLLQFPVVPLPASRDAIAKHLQAAPASTGRDPHPFPYQHQQHPSAHCSLQWYVEIFPLRVRGEEADSETSQGKTSTLPCPYNKGGETSASLQHH